MTEQFANFALSSLSTNIDDHQTTIYIPAEDQSLFPSQGNFRLVVQEFDASNLTPITPAEIMIVTAVHGNGAFTVQRGAENTTPRFFRSGARVSHVVTAGVMQALEAGGGGGGNLTISAGAHSLSSGLLNFQNSNGVSFGLDNAGNLTASAAGGGAAISGGTNSQNAGTVNFSNSGGVSFGLDTNGVMTATVATNYQSQGAYLTTAALSQDSSKYAGTNGAITGGSLTVNTSGVSINLPAYLTTADLSQNSSKYAGINGAITGGSITVNTSGVSVNLPAYLTTAALSQDSSKYAGINGAITGGSITVNTSGVSINLPAYLTTAMQSNAATISNIKVSAGTLSANRSDITFNNSNGITFGLETNGVITATVATNYQSQGAYLTTAALSQDSSKYAGINGAITNGSITVNTSGVSVNVPVQTNQTVGFYAVGNTTQNSSTTLDARTLSFNGLGAASVGYSNGSIQISVPTQGATGAFTAGMTNSGNSSGTSGGVSLQMALVGTNDVRLSQSINGNSATLSIDRVPIKNFIYPYIPVGGGTAGYQNTAATTGSMSINLLQQQNYISATRADILLNIVSLGTAANNSVNTLGLSLWMGVYSDNASTLSSMSTASAAYTLTWSSNSTGSIQGRRFISAPLTINMTPGQYYLMANYSTSSSRQANTLSNIMFGLMAQSFGGQEGNELNVLSNLTLSNIFGYQGMYTQATTGVVPDTINATGIDCTGSNQVLAQPIWRFRG